MSILVLFVKKGTVMPKIENKFKVFNKEGRMEEQMIVIEDGEIVIGSKRSSDVCIPHRYVSGDHCTIKSLSFGRWIIKDEKSTNGTEIISKKEGIIKLTPNVEYRLYNKDKIVLATRVAIFEVQMMNIEELHELFDELNIMAA